MNPHKKLIELEQVFNLYKPLWDYWSNSEYCTLNEDDKYILSVHQQNKFALVNDNLFMFYNQYREISRLTNKLQNSYVEFQEWVIIKFQFTLVKMASQKGWAYSYFMDIDSLKIGDELKAVLKKFNCLSINELSEKHTDEGLKAEGLFCVVTEFLVTYNKVNHANNNLKKGGGLKVQIGKI